MWPKGKKFSKQHRDKIAESLQGNQNTKGYVASEETRKKLSTALKGKKQSKEWVRKRTEKRRGVKRGPLSEEHRKKLSIATKGIPKSKETRERMKTSWTEERKAINTQRLKELWSKDKKFAKTVTHALDKWRREFWDSLDGDQRCQVTQKGAVAAGRANPKKDEKELMDILATFHTNFEFQKPIGNYIVDFFLPEEKIALECDGPEHQWSSNIKKDATRTRILKREGIKVIRIQKQHLLLLQLLKKNIK